MIFQYAYEIDDKRRPEQLVAIAKKYRTLCDIETRHDGRFFFIKFEGPDLETIADLYDKEVADDGFSPGMFWEDYT